MDWILIALLFMAPCAALIGGLVLTEFPDVFKRRSPADRLFQTMAVDLMDEDCWERQVGGYYVHRDSKVHLQQAYDRVTITAPGGPPRTYRAGSRAYSAFNRLKKRLDQQAEDAAALAALAGMNQRYREMNGRPH